MLRLSRRSNSSSKVSRPRVLDFGRRRFPLQPKHYPGISNDTPYTSFLFILHPQTRHKSRTPHQHDPQSRRTAMNMNQKHFLGYPRR
jgi:hypothetical protein